MMEIIDLHLDLNNKPVLRGVSFKVAPGQRLVLSGRNGSGKSSLAYCLAGHPDYVPKQGQLLWRKKDLSKLPPEDRVALGLWLCPQQPTRIEGVKYLPLMRQVGIKNGSKLSFPIFQQQFTDQAAALGLPADLGGRDINTGLSGGQAKLAEFLEAILAKPQLLILDEIDSGLDQHSRQIIVERILMLRETTFIIITHNPSFAEACQPHHSLRLEEGTLLPLNL